MSGGSADFVLLDYQPSVSDMRTEVLQGLAQRPRRLSSKLLYDERGATLFEEITTLTEYYPTRTEHTILAAAAQEIATYAGEGAVLVELGSGSCAKVKRLLDALKHPAAYVPIDIERTSLEQAAHTLLAEYPELRVTAVCADYTRDFELPDISGRKLAFFPGSTFGNFEPDEARGFLDRIRAWLKRGDGLLIGIDLQKDPAVLHAAYNDAKGVTAAFNLNLLERINRELEADFALDRFAHVAFYDAEHGRIEMHLKSLADQLVRVDGVEHAFREGETIHTENSYKYTVAGFQSLAAAHGFTPVRVWTDKDELFSVHYLRMR